MHKPDYVPWDVFEKFFVPEMRTLLRKSRNESGVVAMGNFVNADLWSSSLGDNTAVQIGPDKTIKDHESLTVNSHLHDLPSQRQYCRHITVEPAPKDPYVWTAQEWDELLHDCRTCEKSVPEEKLSPRVREAFEKSPRDSKVTFPNDVIGHVISTPAQIVWVENEDNARKGDWSVHTVQGVLPRVQEAVRASKS